MSSSSEIASRSPYHHGDLRNALLAAARALALEHGPDKVSLREVAKRAGVSHAAAYHHFADKNDLLRAMSVSAFVDLNTAMSTSLTTADGLKPTLEAIAVEYLRFATERSTEFSFMWKKELCMPDGEPDPLADAQRAPRDLVTAYLHSRVGIDLAADADPDLATLALWSFVHGFTMIVLETPAFKHMPQPAREGLAKMGLQQLFSGIAA